MNSLKKLLDENYLRLDSEECKWRTIQYIQDNSSVKSKDIIFVKRITKVSNHIIDTDYKSIDGLMDTLYEYNLEGIYKISHEDHSIPMRDLDNMHSHFYGYLGNISKVKYEQSKSAKDKEKWAKDWYHNCSFSSTLASHVEPTYTVHSRGFAGDAAYELWELTKNKEWLKAVKDCYVEVQSFYHHKKIKKIPLRIQQRLTKIGGLLKNGK